MSPEDLGTQTTDAGLWDWNLVSGRIHFSPRWLALVGCEDHEIGDSPDELLERIHPDDLAQVLTEIEGARGNGPDEFESRHRLRHTDGTYRWMSCRGVAVRQADGSVVNLRGAHTDVTATTVIDALTGLPNRLLLIDRLTHSIERARRYPGFRFALLLVDIGRPVGTAAGLVAGDPVLTTTARRLETSLRVGDATATLRNNDLVARVRDDQIAVLLDGLKDITHAKGVADRLLAAILKPIQVNGRDVFTRPSVGIAVSATGYADAEPVLRDAELAMHRARMIGGSHCEIFDTAVWNSEQAELQLEEDLAPALERREFELFYQPVVSVASRQLAGFEALVRWRHPVLGLVAPQDFIPLAEKTGFIVPLGGWILREACIQLKQWHDTLPTANELGISINLSSQQLKDPELIARVADALRDSGLDPRFVVLELTEGTAMENPVAVRALLMQLRAMGIRISIDDFGTGYSSLAYLRQFPIDILKIDQSLIRGMERQKTAADIVANLTVMAHQLGVYVVAEGVENEEQLTMLRSLGCGSAQGFLFAKPLDVSVAAEFTRTGIVPAPAPSAARRRSVRARPAWLMSAAAAVILLLMGAVNAWRVPVQEQPEVVRRTADISLPAPSPGPRRTAGAPRAGAPSPLPGPVAPIAVAATPTPAANTPATRSTAIAVVHLHRIGSCTGRLTVSADAVGFVPDDPEAKDAFLFPAEGFLHTIADDTLTLRTTDRIFRFKMAADDAGRGDASPLRAIAAEIDRVRFRRR